MSTSSWCCSAGTRSMRTSPWAGRCSGTSRGGTRPRSTPRARCGEVPAPHGSGGRGQGRPTAVAAHAERALVWGRIEPVDRPGLTCAGPHLRRATRLVLPSWAWHSRPSQSPAPAPAQGSAGAAPSAWLSGLRRGQRRHAESGAGSSSGPGAEPGFSACAAADADAAATRAPTPVWSQAPGILGWSRPAPCGVRACDCRAGASSSGHRARAGCGASSSPRGARRRGLAQGLVYSLEETLHIQMLLGETWLRGLLQQPRQRGAATIGRPAILSEGGASAPPGTRAQPGGAELR